jgi:hypothetical protein
MDLKPVESSNIAAVGYDPDDRTLHVKFKGSGQVYAYDGVTPEHHEALMGADSIGTHFHANIRKNFKGSKVDAI